jgi:hypothetical protein
MPVILGNQEVEIGMIMFPGQIEPAKIRKTISQQMSQE